MKIDHKQILIINLGVFLLFLLVAAVIINAITDSNKNTVSVNAPYQLVESSVFVNKISRISAPVLPSPIKYNLDVELAAQFSDKYFSEEYFLVHPELSKKILSFCFDNLSNSPIELQNCETALSMNNTWHKLYIYSGVILDRVGIRNLGYCFFGFLLLIPMALLFKLLTKRKQIL